MAANLLEAVGVLKSFGEVRALDHVSLAVRAGEVHTIVGGNGAGKSTLVKVLSGVCRPDRGELRVDGRPVRFATPLDALRAGIGAVHQEGNLVPMMSVARNLFLGREPRRFGLIDFSRMHDLAAETLAGYGLHVDVRRPLGSLGPGTRQLVAIARAVSTGARVIVLDEPGAALEPAELDTLFAVVDRLRAEGRAIVYVSHRLDELYRVGDRVTVLRDGRVVRTGPLAAIDQVRLVSLMLGRPYRPATTGPAAADPAGEQPADEPGDEPVLTATGLTRRRVLSGVSLALRPGEVLGLGGLLGAGRSATARAIAGALPVDAGQVTVAGAPKRKWSIRAAIRAGISLVPKDRRTEGIVPTLSVRDNIALAALSRLSRAGIVSDARVDKLVADLMDRLHIKATSPRQRVAELSGGNQQKVLLARWLAMRPRVLLLDEPTRGVDVAAKADLRSLIDDLAVDGLAVLLISNDPRELADNCDRVVVLRDGAVVGELSGLAITEQRIVEAIAAVPATGPSGASAPARAAGMATADPGLATP
ncbi:sugar ABC transporter ATP-binding protein [Thermopolyspora flexuosa]|uniref:Monosaccharide ABC transporter ATP-binding protein (CUT2 family) n=1 Tax=Thermopolyspora flexuosa TaxID=103836 RepID=A0A543J4D9_9ACTN|nr:sugar ABC transporter ATP-binding protein [Thermopolyspora flexuosa]TQM77682.1 monosaccharide ABC transporter ATP-binding protein (CUT2 family) [Thermopolyspora flexuosa]GGM71530.1 sugar ABC transporter ATP-binding protein [Thermopolyspora flexuosa]